MRRPGDKVAVTTASRGSAANAAMTTATTAMTRAAASPSTAASASEWPAFTGSWSCARLRLIVYGSAMSECWKFMAEMSNDMAST